MFCENVRKNFRDGALVLRFNGSVVQCSVPGHAETKVPVKLAFLSQNSGTHDRLLLDWILMAQENRDKFLPAEHFVKPLDTTAAFST